MDGFRRTFRRQDGEEGAVAILTAALLMSLLVATSLAVDVGKVAYGSRDQQGATDRVALDSVRLLEAPADAEIVTASQVADFAGFRLDDNPGFASEGRRIVRLTLGRWVNGQFRPGTGTTAIWTADDFPDTTRFPDGPPPSRCLGGPPLGDGEPFDAVCVDTESFVKFSFALGADPGGRWIVRSAVAALAEPIASISAGSRLAAVDGGAVTDLLGLLVGDPDLDLGLVGYDGVARASVDLALLAAELGAGTPDELVDTEVSITDLLNAAIAALAAEDDADARVDATTFLAAISAAAELLGPVRLGDILNLDTGAGAGVVGDVDLFDLVTAGLIAANAEHGIALDADVFGLPVRLTVIEPPQLAVGRAIQDAEGWVTVARTAQLRLEVTLPIGQVVGGVDEAGLDGELDAVQDTEIATIINPLRSAIAAIPRPSSGLLLGTPTCVDVLTNRAPAVRNQIQQAAAEVRSRAESNGIAADVLDSLLGPVFSLLSGLLDGLGCTLAPRAVVDGIKDDLTLAVDRLEAALRHEALAGDGAALAGGLPTLTIQLGSAEAALTGIVCTSDPRSVTMDVTARGGRVHLPTSNLLSLDLGFLGRATVQMGTPGSGAPVAEHQHPVESFGIVETRSYATSSVDVAGLLSGVNVTVDSNLLGIDLTPITSSLLADVEGLLAGLVAPLEEQVLTPVVEVLGVGLGTADVSALSVSRCAGRRLVQ